MGMLRDATPRLPRSRRPDFYRDLFITSEVLYQLSYVGNADLV